MIGRLGIGMLCVLCALPAAAIDLPETAVLTRAEDAPRESRFVPVGPWAADGTEVTRATGAVRREAWRVPGTSLTTAQLFDPLRADLESQGYRILFECSDTVCGGFDFRYELDLLPEPDMHVDLGDFRYLSARAPDDGGLFALTVSRSATTGYIHTLQIDPSGTPAPTPAPLPATLAALPETEAPLPPATITERLVTEGHVALEDLAFAIGSAELEARPFPSLAELAAWLRSEPDTRVTLVGHSDGVGALDSNIALSRARAEAVALRLVEAHGIPPSRLAAEGVGYLAPRASNASEEGRATNRRVEVVLTVE